MKILVFDNYDSFTYNLVHVVEKITNCKVTVKRNDEISLEAISEFDSIILSPGPGIPEEAGLLLPLIKQYAATKKILGVCLGHQAIGEAFGGKLINLSSVFHGVAMPCKVVEESCPIFTNLPNTFDVGRYHSWVVQANTLPSCFTITAVDDEGYIMAMQHNVYNVQSVQFHPESVLTPLGEKIMENWLSI
jgi:anthranilate synthase component II